MTYPYLKFYDEENARWPELCGIEISHKWADKALAALIERFLPGEKVSLCFGTATRSKVSLANENGIFLAYGADCLTLAHEFGHVIEFRWFGESVHADRLRRIINRNCEFLVPLKWHERDLSEQFDAFLLEGITLECFEGLEKVKNRD